MRAELFSDLNQRRPAANLFAFKMRRPDEASGEQGMYMRALGLAALLAATGNVSAGSFNFTPYQTYPVGSRADAVAVGDINGDGREDVVMTTTYNFDPANDYMLFVFFQQKDGTLAAPLRMNYGDGFNGTSLVLTDFDRDGIDDIIIGHQGGIMVVRGNLARKLSGTTIGGPTVKVIDTMDVDQDGRLDIVASSFNDVTIYYGDGNGAIRQQAQLVTGPLGFHDLKTGDLNSDGFDDLVIASGQTVRIYWHNQVSGFMAAPVTIQPGFNSIGGVAIGDFNNDDRNDLAIAKFANSPTKISIFHQASDGTFAAPTDFATYDLPGTMIGGDIDGNGRDDLLVSHYEWFSIGLYAQGALGLEPEARVAAPAATNPKGMAVGDINGDGCKDVAVANYHAGLSLLYGNGCQVRPDLGVAVGLTATTAAIRLEHVSGSTSLAQPLVQIELSVGTGTLQLGTLPLGCAENLRPTTRTRHIECLVDTLVSAAVTTLIVPLSVTTTNRDWLRVSAHASTDTPERSLSNNQVSKQITLSPASKQQVLKRTATSKPASR